MDDFAATQSSIQADLVATTRTAASLAAEDLAFHKSLEPSIGSQLDRQNARLLNLAQRLLGSAVTSQQAVRPILNSIDDVEENWSSLVDSIDSLLEKSSTAIDEFTGAIKRLAQNDKTTAPTKVNKYSAAFRATQMEKPQLHFEQKVSNHHAGPFKPRLTSKPHSKQPLQGEAEEGHFHHPYQQEIESYTFPTSVHQHAEPIMYHDFAETQATFVDSEHALHEMLEELKQAKEIAVDLEHHDMRSFTGITCLMQISTRDKDWIVDTLVPWRHKLECLNEVFADPAVLKVFHGAFMDIIWLQRDLGIYVVGLFDTYGAARSLGYAGCGYAHLLKKHTGVEAQKQFQMADWRQRPLPKELLDYARSDTHYLLYVYDQMRNELVAASKAVPYTYERERVHDVLRRSKETALQRYEYPEYDEETKKTPAWYKPLIRTPVRYTKEQFSVFRALINWRERVAREEDESIHYVLSNALLHTLAREMAVEDAKLASLVPNGGTVLHQRRAELAAVIQKAKLEGADGPDMMESIKQYSKWEDADKAPREKPATAASTIKPASVQNNGVASLFPLRSIRSLFWGGADQKRAMSVSAPIVQLSVPMPVIGDNAFTETKPTLVAPSQQPVESVGEPVDEDIVVLRELSKKRKLATAADEKVQLDEVALPVEEADHAREKAERKRARKEAKLKAAEAAASVEDPEVDYTAVPSMLNPVVDRKDKKKPKKSFDPYSKSLQAPRGLPRVQKETAGRSMTFSR